MTDNEARVYLLVAFAVVAPIGIYYRLRSRTDERLDRRQEGWLILLCLRPLAIACVAGIVTFLINPARMAWAAVPLPGWIRGLGSILLIGAGALVIWTFHNLGHNLTDTVVTRRDAMLVTHGPYRFVRHPLYLATALAVAASILLTANSFVAATGVAAFLAIVARTSIEERRLLDRFGPDYERYMQRTGRFLPRIVRRTV